MAKLFFLVLSVFALVQLIGGQSLGDAVEVEANVASTIKYGLGIAGPELVITVDRNASIVFDLYSTLALGLPVGINSLGFAGSVALGYSLQITPAEAVVLSANLTTPALSAAAQALIAGNANAHFLEYNSELDSYNSIDVEEQTVSNQLVVPLPRAGIYVAVAIGADVAIPSFYGQARALAAGIRKKIAFLSQFVVDVEANVSTTITVVREDSNPENIEAEGKISLDAYWTIETGVPATVNATLTYLYNATQVALKNINEASLQLAFYNEAQSSWEFSEMGGSVDTASKVVSQTTTHFSTWAAYGDSGPSTTAATSESSTSTSSSGATSESDDSGAASLGALAAPLVCMLVAAHF